MTKRCSPIQRLCESIEYDKKTQTLYWHGRWRPPNKMSTKSSLMHTPQPEFSYDHSTVMNVNRFLFFQLYDPIRDKQERIQIRYMLPPLQDELNIAMWGGFIADSRCGIPARNVPLNGKLIVKPIHANATNYRTIPIMFPEVKGEARVDLVMHYLNGGTDADRPLPATKRKAASVPKTTKQRSKG
jgi:hypothetical protein